MTIEELYEKDIDAFIKEIEKLENLLEKEVIKNQNLKAENDLLTTEINRLKSPAQTKPITPINPYPENPYTPYTLKSSPVSMNDSKCNMTIHSTRIKGNNRYIGLDKFNQRECVFPSDK